MVLERRDWRLYPNVEARWALARLLFSKKVLICRRVLFSLASLLQQPHDDDEDEEDEDELDEELDEEDDVVVE